MKISISAALFLASVGSASAFVPATIGIGIGAPLAMVNLNNQRETLGGVGMEVKNVLETDTKPKKPVKPPAPKPIKSQAIPFVNAPLALDGSMAGDVGFDPLGLADSPQKLKKYREAEIAHARLAMLAAAGWPLSELWDTKIAAAVGWNPVLDASGRVPAVLNGGMERISPVYWVGVVLFAGVAELVTDNFRKKKGYTPGAFGFDPLGFYPKGEEDRKWMRTAEIKNGRLAMLAITGFCFQEFYTHLSIIDQSPIFFHPISPQVLMDQQTAGEAIKVAMNGGVSAVTSGADGVSAFDVPATIVEAAPATIVEAAPSAAATIVEAAPSAAATIVENAPPAAVPDVVSEASAAVEATVATPLPAVEAASNSATIAPSANTEELIAAKQRIVELEDKLAKIENLAR